jgi:serine/threonine protein kinase
MSIPQKLGKYEIRRELGSGAMGVVYEGWDPGIARRVALKTVKRDQLDRADAGETLARFQREAQAAGRLSHPNIVAIYEYGEEADGQGGSTRRSVMPISTASSIATSSRPTSSC